jgi:glycosyltransferase involved in cell wall biosynthesis
MDQKQPTVSVILPICNAGRLLRAQVDSILDQTYPLLELLLVDDGSTDESAGIAQEYANCYPFICFRRNEVNQGLLATVNEAAKQVTGDLVALSDHDDVWVPDKVARQVAYLVAHPEVTCVFSDRVIIDIEGRELCASEYTRIGTPPEVTDTAFLLTSMARYTHANTLMFRRKLTEFIFPIPCGWDWWIGAVASWFGQVAFMRDQLVRYRVYEGSVSSNQRLYLEGTHLYTTRAQVQANIQRYFEYATSLRERAQQLAEFNPPMLLIETWWRWYGLLLDLLTSPTWQAYWGALALLPVVGKRQWFKATLYVLPPIHKIYLWFTGSR